MKKTKQGTRGKKPAQKDLSQKDLAMYYINCYRHSKRRESFREYAEQANLKVTRVACFDARRINDNLVCKLRDAKELSKRSDLTPVEVAINYSHAKCWERFLRTNKKYCVVFEDDVKIYKRFLPKLLKTLNALDDQGIKFSVIHLYNGNWASSKSKMKKILQVSKDVTVMQETVKYNAGATCYVLTRDFARYLLDRIFPIREPVDIFIGNQVRKGRHLTIKTSRLANGCLKTPFIYVSCGGIYSTGATTTQNYEVPSVDETKC